MRKIINLTILAFVYAMLSGQVFAYYGVHYGHPYGMMYMPEGYRYRSSSAYYHSYEFGRHAVRDKRRLKYMKEYYDNNGYSGNSYQNGNKVVNVNVSM